MDSYYTTKLFNNCSIVKYLVVRIPFIIGEFVPAYVNALLHNVVNCNPPSFA